MTKEIRKVEKLLKELGLVIDRIKWGGKHPRYYVSTKCGKKLPPLIIATTPGDSKRGWKNFEAQVRRHIREALEAE